MAAMPLARLAVCLPLLGLVAAQPPGTPTPGKVEKRTYDFKEAGKEMEYALFVPSKYDKDKKAALVVALHGLGGNPQQIIRARGLTDLAEKHGYLVVAPMGYNSSGWYGAKAPGGTGGVATPQGKVLSPRVQETLKLTDAQKKQVEELQKEVDARLQKLLTDEQNKQLKGGGQDAPANLRELSEKDVMNVLDLVRKEFAIDEKRIYLIGHSMGGAGTWHIGTKYPDLWAGLAPIAPAAFGQPTGLDKLKDVPVIVVQGDQDTLVKAEGTRRWVAKLKDLNLTHEYVEIAGAGHGDVITKGMPKIFEFFEKQHKDRQPRKEGAEK